MIISHKIRIYPNKTMIEYLEKCFGYNRFCYNRGLAVWQELYKEGKKVSKFLVINTIKQNKEKYMKEWETEYTPNILDSSLNNLEKAFKSFFSKKSKYPKFKSKKNKKDSFTIYRKNDSTIRIIDKKLFLPKFKYSIRMSENIRFNGIIKLCTITKTANKYFASFSIEVDDSIFYKNTNNKTIGIDANIGHFDVSTKENFKHRFNFPLKSLKKYYEKISFYQKLLSRKKHNSNNYFKLKTKIQNIYLKITNKKHNWLHKFTSKLINSYHNICIENLNIKGMIKNKHLSKSISQSLFYLFKIMLSYKSKLHGNNLIIADRFFASTQRCSKCGHIKEGKDKLKLSNRKYICNECNFEIDRDYNSALNLKWYALERI